MKQLKYTENQLWQFVWRADTDDKIIVAEKWLDEHVYPVDRRLWDDLRMELSQRRRSLNGQIWKDGSYHWF